MMLKLPTGESLRYEGKFRYVVTTVYRSKQRLIKMGSTDNPATMQRKVRALQREAARLGHSGAQYPVFDTYGKTAILIDPETLQPIAPPASLTNRLSFLG